MVATFGPDVSIKWEWMQQDSKAATYSGNWQRPVVQEELCKDLRLLGLKQIG